MALRVAGKKPAFLEEEAAEAPMPEEMPVEEEMPEEELPAEEMPQEDMGDEMGTEAPEEGVVDPVVAGYKGPEMGPFMCGNCQFFNPDGSNTCSLVAGPVEPEGVCNLFTAHPVQEEEMPEEGMPEEEMPAEEMPEELPAEELPEEELA